MFLIFMHVAIAHLILTGMTIAEEISTEVNVYHDLRLYPGDCSYNFSDPSLCCKRNVHHHKKGE